MFFLIILGLSVSAAAQQDPGNYDESKIPSYTLPASLVFSNGTKVVSKADWLKRRNELYRLFSTEPGWEKLHFGLGHLTTCLPWLFLIIQGLSKLHSPNGFLGRSKR